MQALTALLCRLDADCRWLKFRLYDTGQPLAEIRYRFEIVLSRGMLERTANEAECAFLLAHELAHLRLDHRAPRNAAERLPLELAADAWAASRLRDVGIDPAAGVALLKRLEDEVAASTPPPPRAEQALLEYRARIARLLGGEL
jgi:predicted Zn-dependent protease